MATIYCDIKHLNVSAMPTKLKLWRPRIRVTTKDQNNIQILYVSKSSAGFIEDYEWNESFSFVNDAADATRDLEFSVYNFWSSKAFGSGTVRISAIGELPATKVVPIIRKGKEVAYLAVLFKSDAEFNRVEQPSQPSAMLADAANGLAFVDHARNLIGA